MLLVKEIANVVMAYLANATLNLLSANLTKWPNTLKQLTLLVTKFLEQCIGEYVFQYHHKRILVVFDNACHF